MGPLQTIPRCMHKYAMADSSQVDANHSSTEGQDLTVGIKVSGSTRKASKAQLYRMLRDQRMASSSTNRITIITKSSIKDPEQCKPPKLPLLLAMLQLRSTSLAHHDSNQQIRIRFMFQTQLRFHDSFIHRDTNQSSTVRVTLDLLPFIIPIGI